MHKLRYTMEKFYKEKKISFKDINDEKLNRIIINGKKINESLKRNEYNLTKCDSYLYIMNLINLNYRIEGYSTNSIYSSSTHTEKYLLFMFSIDPEFEIAIIHATEDRAYDIKNKIIEKFGVYDPYLIKLEKVVIEKLLSKEKQTKISDEIEKRAFK